MENLTKLEKKVLQIISWGDDYESVPTESFANIMDSFDGSKQQLKGVLTSLIKKENISLRQYPTSITSFHLNTK